MLISALVAFAAPILSAGAPPPPLRLKDLDGREVDLGGLAGRSVLVDFWASWCEACKLELPRLREAQREAGDGLVILAVGVDADPRARAQFLERNPLHPLTVLDDSAQRVVSTWDVQAMPTTVLIGPDGRIVHVQSGYTREGLERLLAAVPAK